MNASDFGNFATFYKATALQKRYYFYWHTLLLDVIHLLVYFMCEVYRMFTVLCCAVTLVMHLFVIVYFILQQYCQLFVWLCSLSLHLCIFVEFYVVDFYCHLTVIIEDVKLQCSKSYAYVCEVSSAFMKMCFVTCSFCACCNFYLPFSSILTCPLGEYNILIIDRLLGKDV